MEDVYKSFDTVVLKTQRLPRTEADINLACLASCHNITATQTNKHSRQFSHSSKQLRMHYAPDMKISLFQVGLSFHFGKLTSSVLECQINANSHAADKGCLTKEVTNLNTHICQ